jgi:putative transposase
MLAVFDTRHRQLICYPTQPLTSMASSPLRYRHSDQPYRQTSREPSMPPPATPERDKHPRVPADLMRHGLWLYYRCGLSSRDVAERLCVRGVRVTYAAIRKWCRTFGHAYANQLRRWRPRPGDKGHVDEVCLTLHGARPALWRAVDQDGNGLALLGQRRRNTPAAPQCFRTLLKGLPYVPRVLITAKLKSEGAAQREMLPGVAPRQHRSRHNRAEHSHQPTRQRERRMQGLTSAGHAQRFLAAYGPIAHHFRPRRPRLSAPGDRQEMPQRVPIWAESTGTERAAAGPQWSDAGPLSSFCYLQTRSARIS